jgi:hypothetical protein
MEVINQLRTNGKITEGEFNFMNDQAGRAQDSADAGMEKTAKSTMQRPWSRSKPSRPLLLRTEAGYLGQHQRPAGPAGYGQHDEPYPAGSNSQAVKIAVELVGPDGKYRTDARSALAWLTAPCRKSSPMPKAVPFLAPVPAPRTASSAG